MSRTTMFTTEIRAAIWNNRQDGFSTKEILDELRNFGITTTVEEVENVINDMIAEQDGVQNVAKNTPSIAAANLAAANGGGTGEHLRTTNTGMDASGTGGLAEELRTMQLSNKSLEILKDNNFKCVKDLKLYLTRENIGKLGLPVRDEEALKRHVFSDEQVAPPSTVLPQSIPTGRTMPERPPPPNRFSPSSRK